MLNVNIKESEWPDWASWVAQDADGWICFYEKKPQNNKRVSPDEWYSAGRYELRKQYNDNPHWKQAIMKRPQAQTNNIEPERKHSHYYKDVRHLDFIDVYRVIDLFEVDNECLQHALKKILVSGKRGAKDQAKDVQEAIDTLTRWQEMQDENERQEKR